ncbi:MAG: ATP-binding cassette domain-containing protein [Bacteroidetes bacterium]|nr:ATP-binding cassette domain-containing protein [Bacteroidota bacterium]
MTLFSIKNLVCSYDRVHPVLYISDLEIPSGEICVLFGKSGSGKSTLLETLGLMTNTISSTPEPFHTVFANEKIQLNENEIMSLKFYGRHSTEEPEEITFIEMPLHHLLSNHKNGFKGKRNHSVITDIWKDHKKQHRLQQRLRDEYFAFIFQNTNLMPNFSAEENAAIPEMIDLKKVYCKKDKNICPFPDFNADCDLSTEMCAIVHARQTLARDLNISEDMHSRPVRQLSGGQQQRVAFARANNSHFSVLFGDEPTGNLDFSNSQELMKVIRNLIDNFNDNKTRSAIIVSHDINLTLQFANRIVFIETKRYDKDRFYGKIDSNMVYVSDSPPGNEKRGWRHLGYPEKILSFKEMKAKLIDFLHI